MPKPCLGTLSSDKPDPSFEWNSACSTFGVGYQSPSDVTRDAVHLVHKTFVCMLHSTLWN